ncbi:TonB-dependent receptor [Cellvibrio polysaccharolyticus]|uniref:TonB-dependent receptor n=1 Tax=Cellvibrio polysaccharolyticus TaxID=2082724 RepID=A0A928V5L4_9GAMM|nr:TonB-dependent receptor [Cellvibrio polysaccharolyticus]MBE8716539.1 TonB-dependent receptor [Cellvibrio polysaccharolyticus]
MNKKYTHPFFKISLLSLAVAATAQAYAQEDTVEEIVVTGYKASLKSALDTKRDSSGVVDAISSEDIGKFPDTNLAESLQRITGVSIDRSGGEGRQVTVRGLGPQFNTVLLNGRQMPSANASRGFNFDTVAAEMVSGVEVYKTSTATTQSGGIGATINVNTAKPLDLGHRIAGSVKGLNETNVSSITPAVSGLFSTTFNDNFGVLAAISYQEREYQSDSVEQRRWDWRSRRPATLGTYLPLPDAQGNTINADFYPTQTAIKRQEFNRERLNGSLVLQYKPADNLSITVDAQYSDLQQDGMEYESAAWYGYGNDEQYAIDDKGTIVHRTVTDAGLDFFVNNPVTQETGLSTGIEVDWDITDRSKLVFAHSHSTAEAQPDRQANISRSDLQASPISFDFAIRDGIASHYYNNADVSLANARIWQYDGYSDPRKDEIQQTRLDYTFNEDTWSIKTGVMYTDQSKLIEQYQAKAGTVLQGAYDLVGSDPTTSIFRSVEEAANAGYKVAHMNHAVLGNLAYFSFDPLAFNDWTRHAQTDPTATAIQKDLTNSTLVRQPNWSDITEKTFGVYVEGSKSFDLNGRDLTVVLGARYEDTSIDSISLEQTLVSLTPPPVEGEEYTRVFSGETPFKDDGSYDVFLPNLSVKYDLLENVVLRFAASRTITRPELNDMKSARTLSGIRQGQAGIGSAGNPNLKPFMSDNFDISAEWYINDFDYISIGAFSKSIDNFVVTEASPEAITGVIDPATGRDVVFEMRRPRNLDTKDISGIEIGGQHIFGDSGFGVIANATFVFADPEYDYFTPLGEVPAADAVVGVSDSANLVGFYENGPFQIRIAYNWRDSFIRGFQYFYSSTSNEPVVVEDYSQVDISMSYDLNDNVSLFLEGINVTEEGSRIHGREKNHMYYTGEGVGRYAIGIRASF